MKPTIEEIIELSTFEAGITREDMFKKSRKASITDCRKFASLFIYLFYGIRDYERKDDSVTFVQIGNIVGLDHSSVICSCRKLLTLIETDRSYRLRFEIMASILVTN